MIIIIKNLEIPKCPAVGERLDLLILLTLSVILCGHWKSHKLVFNYTEEIVMSYGQYLYHSEQQCCGWIFPQSFRRKLSDPLSTQTEILMKLVCGAKTAVLVYRTTISPGAENQVGDQRILCPTNGCTVSIFSSLVFLRGGGRLDQT